MSINSINNFIFSKGAEDENEEFTLANNVIVFMAVGINTRFQQPVAFYFIRTLVAEERVELIKDVMTQITKRGVQVKNITFDGNPANIKMCTLLGADFSSKTGDYVTHFLNPLDNSRTYIIFDFSHVEKLVRNTLGNKRIFWYNAKKIEWSYFVELVKLSSESSIGLTHKLNKRHLEYADRAMHVRTAVETMSKSTADAMEYCRKNGVPGFENSNETIEFTRIMDTLWDIMNSQRILRDSSNKYKSAINPENKGDIFKFLLKAKRYLFTLEISSKKTGKKMKIVDSNVRTGFRGYIIDIISITAMYQELVEDHHNLLFLVTYRMSQDHLEMFFCKIRSMNGFNENPMSQQFISAYRKLLNNSDISITDRANVISRGEFNVLTVSSGAKKFGNLQKDVAEYSDRTVHVHLKKKNDPFSQSNEDEDELFDSELLENNNYLSDNLYDIGVCYISNLIERRLTTCKQINCGYCAKVFIENEKMNQNAIVSGHLGRPFVSTYQLCKLTDRALKVYVNTGPKFKEKVYLKVLGALDWVSIFPIFSEPHHDLEHKHFLVKFIINEYINKKCAYLAKQITILSHKRYTRNNLRKLAHNKHL